VEKETEKKLKYKNLGIEIQQMWNLKYVACPKSLCSVFIKIPFYKF
jgi:hypothetical protein